MPLLVDYKKIENWEEKCKIPMGKDPETGEQLYREHPMFFTLHHLCMVLGMPGITEKNCEEFWTRVWIYERAFGCFLRHKDGSDRPITPDDVRDYINMSCNVAQKSKVQFKTQVMNALRWECKKARQQWEKDKETAVEQLGEAVEDANG